MKILHACRFFSYCSGSAMYVHNLAMEQVKQGHDVTIFSEMGGEIANSALKQNIKLVDFSQIFSIENEKFDIMHLHQWHPADMAFEFFPDTPAVYTIHSELSSIEKPYTNPNIKKYIGVRSTIMEKYKDLNPVLIPIPVDFEKFNRSNEQKIIEVKKEARQTKKIVLYVGTIDRLRENIIKDLCDKALEEDFDFWIVGRNFLPYQQPGHIKVFPETFFVEKYYEMADEIAGILMGSTVLEGWACGKPYRWYEVDDNGIITSEKFLSVPDDISQYDLKTVASEIQKVYESVI